jgi:hypothetical protein
MLWRNYTSTIDLTVQSVMRGREITHVSVSKCGILMIGMDAKHMVIQCQKEIIRNVKVNGKILAIEVSEDLIDCDGLSKELKLFIIQSGLNKLPAALMLVETPNGAIEIQVVDLRKEQGVIFKKIIIDKKDNLKDE